MKVVAPSDRHQRLVDAVTAAIDDVAVGMPIVEVVAVVAQLVGVMATFEPAVTDDVILRNVQAGREDCGAAPAERKH
ncbi:MAG: hypothetical protein JO107_04580 [Hyphomicrobiales bacterium]|nr:hypothetical protein [Hyphomicrobiales bacterium]MBV8662357.1 hypothetical protein [Hyphomicrobiales bacterium]